MLRAKASHLYVEWLNGDVFYKKPLPNYWNAAILHGYYRKNIYIYDIQLNE